MWWRLLLLLLLAAAAAAWQPVVDEPYEELLATRMPVPGQAAPPQWPRLPWALLPTQAVAATLAGVDTALLLLPDGAVNFVTHTVWQLVVPGGKRSGPGGGRGKQRHR